MPKTLRVDAYGAWMLRNVSDHWAVEKCMRKQKAWLGPKRWAFRENRRFINVKTKHRRFNLLLNYTRSLGRNTMFSWHDYHQKLRSFGNSLRTIERTRYLYRIWSNGLRQKLRSSSERLTIRLHPYGAIRCPKRIVERDHYRLWSMKQWKFENVFNSKKGHSTLSVVRSLAGTLLLNRRPKIPDRGSLVRYRCGYNLNSTKGSKPVISNSNRA